MMGKALSIELYCTLTCAALFKCLPMRISLGIRSDKNFKLQQNFSGSNTDGSFTMALRTRSCFPRKKPISADLG